MNHGTENLSEVSAVKLTPNLMFVKKANAGREGSQTEKHRSLMIKKECTNMPFTGDGLKQG